MNFCMHCVNGVAHLLFLAEKDSLTIPPRDDITGTYNLARQVYFLDPLTQAPLYIVLGDTILRERSPETTRALSDKLLYELLEIKYERKNELSDEEIVAIQQHPLLTDIVHNSPHRGTIAGLYEIVEVLADNFVYGPGNTVKTLTDCLVPANRFVCSGVTAVTAACLASWKVPLRIGLGYGKNITFSHEDKLYNYFMDNDPSFGAAQHCWLEIYLNDEWVTFDPTIYMNKYKTKPSTALLMRYREVVLQKNIPHCLYQFVVADYLKLPYERNFIKTLLLFSGGEKSTMCLSKLLSETQDVIHVHHLKSDDPEAEQKVEAIIRYFQERSRPFLYTDSLYADSSLSTVVKATVDVLTDDIRGKSFDRVVFGVKHDELKKIEVMLKNYGEFFVSVDNMTEIIECF